MKKTIKRLGAATMICAAFLQSCTKDAQADKVSVSSVEDLMKEISPETQIFTIDPTKENTITGKDGTQILIPAHALVDANGNVVSGSVTISLQEILSLKDQFTSEISATSDGKMLSSGGEFFFEVNQNGQKLNVALNSEITVTIPAEKVDTNMQVFIAQKVNVNQQNDSVKGDVNWVPGNDNFVNLDSNNNVKEYDYAMEYGLQSYIMKINDLYNTSGYNVDQQVGFNNIIWNMLCKVHANDNFNHEDITFQVKVIYKKYGYAGWFSNENIMVNDTELFLNEEWAIGEQPYVVVVGVGKNSKNIYYGKTQLTISANSQPNISLKTISKEELEKELENL